MRSSRRRLGIGDGRTPCHEHARESANCWIPYKLYWVLRECLISRGQIEWRSVRFTLCGNLQGLSFPVLSCARIQEGIYRWTEKPQPAGRMTTTIASVCVAPAIVIGQCAGTDCECNGDFSPVVNDRREREEKPLNWKRR